MTPVRARRARAVVRALVVLAAVVVLGLAHAPGPSAPAAVSLGGYALTDTGFLGIPVNPPVPTNVSAVPHDGSALVSWTRATPNTSTVVSYRVYVGGTLKTQVAGTQASATVTGLTNYQVSPQITVRTFDSDGRSSGDSNGVTTTPYDDVAPSAVTGLTATRGDGRVTLTWEPESAMEADRAGVRVYVDGALRTSLPTATTAYDVTGLTNDRRYSFHLVAHDARPNGYGPPGSVAPNASTPSATVQATPTDLTPPSAPAAFAAVRGDGRATLTWTAPPEDDVDHYEVVDETGARVASFNAPATSGTAGGLTNGQAYRLRLVAVDTHGNYSPASAEVGVTPAKPPAARTGLVATPGDRQVSLSWDPQDTDARRAVATSVDVLVDRAVRTTVTGTATTVTITGLTNDVGYDFSLIAVDAEGRTSAETARVRATPTDLTPPSAPTAFAAVRGDTTAALTWTAPPENDVGRYEVVDDTGALVASFTAPTTSGTATALTNGQTYRLRLVAVDTHGNRSVPSGRVTVTPATPPVVRTGLVATAGDGKVFLTWDPPVADARHAVAASIRVRVLADGVERTPVLAVSGTTTTYTVDGLTNERPYELSLVAVDAQGRTSPETARASATPTDLTAPATPTGVSVVRGDTAGVVSWQPVGDGDLAGYRVQVSTDGSTWSDATPATTTGTTLAVTGLTNGQGYRVRVLAHDGKGNVSPPSAAVPFTPLAPPVATTGLTLTMDGDVAVLTWTAPTVPAPSDREAAVDVVVRRVGTPDAQVAVLAPGATTYRVENLAAGEPASFYLVARDGDPRESVASATVSTRLPAPLGVGAAPGDTVATVSWNAVPGAAHYRVEHRLDTDGAPWTAVEPVNGTSVRVEPLTNMARYRFRVVAVPVSGLDSLPSAEVVVTIGRAPAPTTVPAGGSASSGVAVSRDERFALVEIASSAGVRPELALDDLVTGTRRIIARPRQGLDDPDYFAGGTGVAAVAISENGQTVAVATTAAIDAAHDTDGATDVYRYTVSSGRWSLVSAPRDPGDATLGSAVGVPGTASADDPTLRPRIAVSDDGAIFFTSRGPLVDGVSGLAVFVQRTADGPVELASDPAAAPYDDEQTSFVVDLGGTRVAYVSNNTLCPGRQLVLHTIGTAGSVVLSRETSGSCSSTDVNHASGQFAVSDDAAHVVWSTGADGPATVHHSTRASDGAYGPVADVGTSSQALAQVAVAPDGSAAFYSTSEPPAGFTAGPDDTVDVYRQRFADGAVQRATQPVAGSGGSLLASSYGPIRALSADTVVVVTPQALIGADGNGTRDAYVLTLPAGGSTWDAHPLVGAAPHAP